MIYDVKNDVVLCHFTIIGSIEQAKYTVSRSVFINHSVAYSVVRPYRCNSISV